MVSDLNNLAHKGCKIATQKKVRFSTNFALLAGFFWYQCYYPHRSRDALSPVRGIFLSWERPYLTDWLIHWLSDPFGDQSAATYGPAIVSRAYKMLMISSLSDIDHNTFEHLTKCAFNPNGALSVTWKYLEIDSYLRFPFLEYVQYITL